MFNTVIQPFPIYFNCNDYHIMLYFKRHPEYESIEAFIQEREKGDPFIRVIITRLDQTQVDHINDSLTVDYLKARRRKREIYHTPIKYKNAAHGGKAHITLEFLSFKGENILFDFFSAAKASTKHASLIDPGGHSMHISLPVMYPEKTTLAGGKSKILIDDVKYEMPVKIWIPLLFKGMKGYYSEIFSIGVIRAGLEELKLISTPQSIALCEKWIYETGGEVISYEIIKVENDVVTLKKQDETIVAKIHDENLELIKVSCQSYLTNRYIVEYSIDFSPALPISTAPGSSPINEVDFSISIGQHSSLVTGVARRQQSGDMIKLMLVPLNPDWCIKRPVSTTIIQKENLFSINTEIKN